MIEQSLEVRDENSLENILAMSLTDSKKWSI